MTKLTKISNRLRSQKAQREKKEAEERSVESYAVFDFILMFIFIPANFIIRLVS